MDKSVEAAAIPDQQNEESVKYGLFPEWSSGASSEKFGTIYEAVSAATIPDQNN